MDIKEFNKQYSLVICKSYQPSYLHSTKYVECNGHLKYVQQKIGHIYSEFVFQHKKNKRYIKIKIDYEVECPYKDNTNYNEYLNTCVHIEYYNHQYRTLCSPLKRNNYCIYVNDEGETRFQTMSDYIDSLRDKDCQFGQSWFDTKDVDKIEKFLKNDFSIKKVISLFAINHGL